MQRLTIKKSIDIKASREKVWNILTNEALARSWYAVFGTGCYADTDWRIGSKTLFIDDSGGGIVGQVVANKTYELISVEYDGIVTNGKEDYESEVAKAVRGGRETYSLLHFDDTIHLAIETDMGKEWFVSMSLAWDKALQKIRQLAEQN